MRAFVLDKYGAPLRKASVPEPVAGPHQVLVRVAAAGVCHADERMRTGKFKAILPHDLPAAMGGELSGEVVAVGDRVGGFAVGDEVYAYTGARDTGAFTEVAAVDADAVALKPRSLPTTQAAALPVDLHRRIPLSRPLHPP